jgi:hypothetical protein
MARTPRKSAAKKAPAKRAAAKKAPAGSITLIAPEGVGSLGTADGTFDVVGGRITVPITALNDALGSGFEIDPDNAPPEVTAEATPEAIAEASAPAEDAAAEPAVEDSGDESAPEEE